MSTGAQHSLLSAARSLWVFATACLFLHAATAAGADGPRLQSSHSPHANITSSCNDVSWLNPPGAPPFLVDVSQAAGTSHCQFHEFASQNVFSLLLGSHPTIATWPTSDQVYPASGVPNCASALPLGRSTRPTLKQELPQVIKAGAVGDINEAKGGPLVDQDGRYVQFEIRVDPQLCQVVTSCQFYTTSCVNAVFQNDPNFRFPAGNVASNTPGVAEMKLAWRVMETCNLPDSPANCKPTDLTKFVTVPNVSVSPYSPANNGPVTVTLGLVGFHLIQKTPSHPELIWATWEHISNNPVCSGSDNSTCQDHSTQGSVGTASGWSLANPPANSSSDCSKSPPPPNCANVSYSTNPSPQPPTQVCRVFPCGNGDQTQIASLNQAIRNHLAAGSVWWNYFLVGTLWGSGNTSNGGDPSQPNAGSVNLANSTMETYFQTSAHNCFTCHTNAADSQPSHLNLDFTHSLVRAQQAGGSCSVNFNTCAAAPAPATPAKR
jgi:hypothetical protein